VHKKTRRQFIWQRVLKNFCD